MPRAHPVLTGQRFGRLTVIDPERFAPPAPSQIARNVKRGNRMPLCRCDCGTELQVKQHSLRTGETNSCGCLNREIVGQRAAARNLTHGMTHHPLFGTWYRMVDRCENPGYKQFRDYGGRGIRVCGRWHDVRLFAADIEQLLGPRPASMTLDRINNNGNYEPGNVRWATWTQQNANRRRGHQREQGHVRSGPAPTGRPRPGR
jgi:hypothetical protein